MGVGWDLALMGLRRHLVTGAAVDPKVAAAWTGSEEGKEFVRTRTLTHDGDFPNNTSGGQLSAGQAGCAGGFLGMVEAVRQLTGAAGERAVKDAKLGLVSGFGMVTYDRCLCTGAVILGRSS